MKKIDVGQTIAILANVGVIAGIIFLAIEIGQNQAALDEQNTLTRLSGRDATLEYFSGFRKLLLEHPELHRIWTQGRTGEVLTAFESTRFRVLCLENLYASVTVYNRFDALGLTQERDAQAQYVANLISASGATRECWASYKTGLWSRGYSDFVSAVESLD